MGYRPFVSEYREDQQVEFWQRFQRIEHDKCTRTLAKASLSVPALPNYLARLPNGSSTLVLDVACGPRGACIADVRRQFGVTGFGIDLSIDSVAKDDSVSLHVHNATKPFPFINGTFDFAYSVHLIEHLDADSAYNVMMNTLAVLKPGATFIFNDPENGSWRDLIRKTPIAKLYRVDKSTRSVWSLTKEVQLC